MKFRDFVLPLSMTCSIPLLAQENATKIIFSLDLLNRQTIHTKASFAGSSNDITGTELKSAKPGGLQIGLFGKGWVGLANIAPDTATTGLVGAGLETWPGQYLGLSYNLNSVEFSDAMSSSRQEFYGFMGFHVLTLVEGQQRITAFWTLGPTYTETRQVLLDGSEATGRGQGTMITMTLRYLFKLNDNLNFSPAIKGAFQSSQLKANGKPLKREISRYEFVPVALQIRI